MAKIQGDDDKFKECRRVSELMYGPVINSYVMGIRDIAFLEPTLVELLGATCLYAMAETVNEAERRGISERRGQFHSWLVISITCQLTF